MEGEGRSLCKSLALFACGNWHGGAALLLSAGCRF